MSSAEQSELPRRLILSGMFDMKNFGDLMFPLIARERLAEHHIEIVPVAPTNTATGFADAMRARSLEEMINGEIAADGVAVGGGYIIHGHKMHFLDEYQAGGLADFAGPGLWLGATLAAAVGDVPIVWNAPGVPHPFTRNQRGLVDAALSAADYLSVRDRGSFELLGAPIGLAPSVVPDPVADIARLWKPNALREPFETLVRRKGGDPERRHFALHFRNRSLTGVGVPAAAAWIDEFSRAHDLCPILVAVGQTHADDTLAREIAQHLKTQHIVLDDPVSLVEIAAAVGMSSLYVGASLHGYVAAAAYGVPGVLVAQPSYRKFQGFLDHTGRQEDLARNWREAFDIASRRIQEERAVRIPRAVFDALDVHWWSIADALGRPDRNRSQRHAFLQSWLRTGIETGGPAWPHLPYAKRGVVGSAST